MATNFKNNGTDIDTLFEPIGSSTKRADIGYKVNGVDISNGYYDISHGGTKGPDCGYKVNGVDISNYFAAAGTVSYFNALWSGNSTIVHNGYLYGLETSGSLFRFNGGDSPQAWLSAYTDGTFQSGGSLKYGSIGYAAGGYSFSSGSNTIAYGITSYGTTGQIYFNINSGFSGSSHIQYMNGQQGEAGLETSGGYIRHKLNNNLGEGAWVSLT